LFTAFEGGEARQVQMKVRSNAVRTRGDGADFAQMSQANATQFSNMVEKIKEKLAAA